MPAAGVVVRVALQNKARLRRLDLYCKFGKQMDGPKERQSDKSERVMEMEGGRAIRGGGEVFALAAWQNLEVIKDSVQ